MEEAKRKGGGIFCKTICYLIFQTWSAVKVDGDKTEWDEACRKCITVCCFAFTFQDIKSQTKLVYHIDI